MRTGPVILTSVVALAAVSSPALAQTVPGFNVQVYSSLPRPVGLSFNSPGVLFCGRDDGIGGCTAFTVRRIPPGGGAPQDHSSSGIADPDCVVVDPDGSVSGVAGSVVVGSGCNGSQLRAVRPDGSVVTLATSATIGNPAHMLIEPGRLVFTSDNDRTLVQYLPGSGVSVINAVGLPFSLARDAAGNMYSGCRDGAVRIFAPDGTILHNAYASGLGDFTPVAIGPGNYWGTALYVVARATGELRRYSAPENYIVIGTGFGPVPDLEFGPDGALYASTASNQILRIECRTPQPPAVPRGIACPTGTATFTATTPGLFPTYQWQRETEPGSGIFTDLNDGPADGWDGADPEYGAVIAGSSTETLTIAADTANSRQLGPAHAILYRASVVNVCGQAYTTPAPLVICRADYNCDGFVDGIDSDSFNNDFESSDPQQQARADYNGDGFVDGIDYDLFNNEFEAGC